VKPDGWAGERCGVKARLMVVTTVPEGGQRQLSTVGSSWRRKKTWRCASDELLGAPARLVYVALLGDEDGTSVRLDAVSCWWQYPA
jgi:hypothetical protein